MKQEEIIEQLKEKCVNYDDDLNECDNMCSIISSEAVQYYKCCALCSKIKDCSKACGLAKKILSFEAEEK
jgi:hypothetical protein